MYSPRFRILWLVAVGLSLIWTSNVAAQSQEYKLKAVFLYNFGMHIKWPANNDPNFVIGIVGKYPPEPFGSIMRQMQAKKTVKGKKIVVKYFPTMQQYKPPCHLLFISKDAHATMPNERVEERLADAVKATEGSPVLIVTESPGLAKKGAMINFVVDVQDANRLLMDMNRKRAQQEKIEIGSDLSSLPSVRHVD